MGSRKTILLRQWCENISQAVACVTVITGLLVIIGWVFNIVILKSIDPAWISMKFNTAFCFLLCGLCLLLSSTKPTARIKTMSIQLLSFIVFAISSLTVYQYLFHVNLGIDEVIFIDDDISDTTHFHGRMSFATAINFILFSLAFIAHSLNIQKWMYQLFIGLTFPSTLVSLLIYLLGIDTTHIGAHYFYMALHTTILFLLLCFGTFMLEPEVGVTKILLMNNIGGRFVRRVLPIALSIPIVVIYFVNEGMGKGFYEPQFGNILTAIILVSIASIFIYINGSMIDKEEEKLEEINNALIKSGKMFQSLAENIEDVIWQTTVDSKKIFYVNKAVEKVWGLSRNGIYHNPKSWFEAIVAEDQPRVKKIFSEDILKNNHASANYKIKKPDGTLRHIYDRAFILTDEMNKPTSILGVATDITALWDMSQQEKIASTLEHIIAESKDVYYTAIKTLHLLCDTFNWDLGEVWLVNEKEQSILYKTVWYNPTESDSSYYDMTQQIIFSTGRCLAEEIAKNGKYLWISSIDKNETILTEKLVDKLNIHSLLAIPMIYAGKIYGVMAFFNSHIEEPTEGLIKTMNMVAAKLADHLDKVQAEEQIKQLLYIDNVTGFLNQPALINQINERIHSMNIKHAALIVIYIYSYEAILNVLGFDAANNLMQIFSDRIRKDMHEQTIIARLDNNNIAIFIDDFENIDSIISYAKNILSIFDKPSFIKGENIYVKARIGISLFPEDSDEPKKLIEYANMASAEHKDISIDQFQFYTKELPIVSSKILKLEMALRHAIAHNEFEMYYQPQIDLSTGLIIGLEALIRWKNQQNTMVSPNAFIPLAESTGLIISIDEWVLYSVFKTIQQGLLKEANAIQKVSINISSLHFQKKFNLASLLNKLTKEFNIAPSIIEIEVTEGILLHNPEDSINFMKEIAKQGFNFSLDDFGTGYTSLNYLLSIPSDKLKIDKSFIDKLFDSEHNAAIVSAIITLSHQLGKKVVAEGVETKEQVEFLKNNGCDMIQGYYFSKPLPLVEIKKLLASNKVMNIP